MKKKISLLFLAIISLIFHRGTAQANSVDNFGIGSEAASLAGAFTAAANDPFAVFYNPAGLAQEKKKKFSGGTLVLNTLLKADNYRSGNTAPDNFEDTSDNCYSPHFGYSARINSKFALGIAAYVPYGLSLKWKDDPRNNPGAYNAYQAWYVREVVTPGIAYNISDRLSVGAGVSLGSSQTGKKLISQGISHMLRSTTYFKTDFKDDLNYSYNLGIMYRPNEKLSLGLTYRSRTEADFEGDCTIESNNSHLLSKTKFDVELKNIDHPEQVQAGIRYTFNDKLSIEADVLWIHWSIVKKETIVFKDATPQMQAILKGNTKEFDRNWEDTTQIKLGVEYRVNKILSLRCGYYDDPSPIPDDSFDLEWPGCSKRVYTFGTGLDFDKFSLDTVFIYSKSETRIIDKGESDNLNKSYLTGDVYTEAKGSIFGVGLTLSYSF